MNQHHQHRQRSWLAAALTLVILVSAGAGIMALRHRADARRQSQVVLGSMEASVSRQSVEMMSLVGFALASGDSRSKAIPVQTANVREEIAELEGVFRAGATELRRSAPADGHIDAAIAEAERLQNDLEAGLDLMEAGDYANAYIYGLRRTKPTYERFEERMVAATATLGHQAERAMLLGDAGGVTTLLAALGLLSFLRRRMENERKAFQQQLQHEALHDPLTDLPNRRLFRDRVENACKRRSRGHGAAVLCIDLDGFKDVNDTHGHDAGDRALRTVSETLLACVREGDTVARIGGDEFAILLPDVTRPVEAAGLAGRILDRLDKTFRSSAEAARLGASVGIAVLGPEGESAEELCSRADAAMYLAKRAGKGAYRIAPPVFVPGADHGAARDTRRAGSLATA